MPFNIKQKIKNPRFSLQATTYPILAP